MVTINEILNTFQFRRKFLFFLFSTCSSGKWQCTNNTCPRTCTVMGNGHIDTFDGKTYTLIGSCQYTLLEVWKIFNFYLINDFLFSQGTNSDASSKLRVMYTNNQNINTNELVIVHYGNTVTLKGSQIIVNGHAGPELPYKINDLLIRQATSVLVGVEGKFLIEICSDFYFDI